MSRAAGPSNKRLTTAQTPCANKAVDSRSTGFQKKDRGSTVNGREKMEVWDAGEERVFVAGPLEVQLRSSDAQAAHGAGSRR